MEKIISFLFLVPSSMLSTVSALGAQCIGAGKPRRALQTLWYAIAIALGFGIIITIIIQFVAEPVVGLFTDDAAVAAAGGQYLRGYILDCCLAGLHFCFSGFISRPSAASWSCSFCTTHGRRARAACRALI